MPHRCQVLRWPVSTQVNTNNTQEKLKLGIVAVQYHLEHLRARKNNAPVPMLPMDLDRELFAAIKAGNLIQVKELIAKGANVNAIDNSDANLYSPLHLAVTHALPGVEPNRWDIVRFLTNLPNINLKYIASGNCNKTAVEFLQWVVGNEEAAYKQSRKLGRELTVKPNPVPNLPLHQQVLAPMLARANAALAIVSAPQPTFSHDSIINSAKHQLDTLYERDMEVQATVYVDSLQQVLKAGSILEEKHAQEVALIDTNREGMVFERALLESALNACITGENLEVIATLAALGEDNSTWQMFCVSKPLHLAIKHQQIGAVEFLIAHGAGYSGLFSNDDIEQAKILAKDADVKIDLRPGSMLHTISTHMRMDVVRRLNESAQDNQTDIDEVSLQGVLAILGQKLLNEVANTTDTQLHNEITNNLDEYFAAQEQVYAQHRIAVDETFDNYSQEYLKLAQSMIDEHGEKIKTTKDYYVQQLDSFIQSYYAELQRQRDAHDAAMRELRKKKRKGITKAVVGALAAAVVAVAAPYLLGATLTTLKTLTTLQVIGIGAVSSGVGAVASGANRKDIIKGMALGAATAGAGSVAGSAMDTATKTAASLTEIEKGILKQVATAAASSAPGAITGNGKYLESFVSNLTGSLINSNIPKINMANTPGGVNVLKGLVRETSAVLVSSTPAFIGSGNTKDKLLRFAMQAGQNSAQRVTGAFLDAAQNNENKNNSSDRVNKIINHMEPKPHKSATAGVDLNKNLLDGYYARPVQVDLRAEKAKGSDGYFNFGASKPEAPKHHVEFVESNGKLVFFDKNVQAKQTLEQQVKFLQQQKDALVHGEAKSYSHTFKNKEYENGFVKASEEFSRLFVQHQKDSDFYHTQQESLKAQTGLFKGAAAMEASSDLEESVGKKVFAQANRLQQLHDTMRRYVVDDISKEINGIENQLRRREADAERWQRAATGNESTVKHMAAEIGLKAAGFMRDTELYIDSFAARHRDAVNVGKFGAAVAGATLFPVASTISLGKYIILSSPSVQTGMKKVFNSSLKQAGVDSYSREDLSRYATEATTLVGSGISYAQLGKRIGGVARTTLNLAEKTVTRVKEVSPVTFQYEAGRLNSGIPVDAVKLRNPFKSSSGESALGKANLAQAEKMKVELELLQIFTKDGKLTEVGIAAAEPIMGVKDFHVDAPVRKMLSGRSDIKDWHKCAIPMKTKLHVPGKEEIFNGEVHVYKNLATKEIFYDLDYKIKINKLDIHTPVNEFLNNISYTWRPKL